MSQRVPHVVAFTVDDDTAGPAAVAACSVLANSPADFHFALLDLGLRDASRSQLADAIGSQRTTFLGPPRGWPPALPPTTARRRFPADFAKYLLPTLLQERCGRLVFLDCHTLAVRDLGPLFELPLHGAPVAAVPRPEDAGPGRPADPDTAVLVMDVRRCVQQRIGPRVIEHGCARPPVSHGDAGPLAAVLGGDWLRLGQEWNVVVDEPRLRAYDGLLPIAYQFPMHGRDATACVVRADLRLMYDEYRALSVAAGGPPF